MPRYLPHLPPRQAGFVANLTQRRNRHEDLGVLRMMGADCVIDGIINDAGPSAIGGSDCKLHGHDHLLLPHYAKIRPLAVIVLTA